MSQVPMANAANVPPMPAAQAMVQERREISQAMDRLEGVQIRCSEIWARVQARIQPITSPTPPANTEAAGRAGATSELAEVLNRISDQLQALSDNMENTESRIQL